MKSLNCIFIIGSSRSGTTMLSRVLAKQESVYTFNELHFFSQIFIKYRRKKIDYSAALNVLSELFKRQYFGLFSKKRKSDFKELSLDILDKKSYDVLEVFKIFIQYELHQKQKEVACFHTPNNIYYIEEIVNVFPNSKFINMVRDNRDVLLSQKNKWKRKFLGARKIPFFESLRSFANYHPITTSIVWNSSLNMTREYRDRADFFVLKFEEFLLSPENKCVKLCKFLELDYQPEMLEIANIGSSNMKDSQEKRIDATKVNKWQAGDLSNSEIYLAQFFSKSIMKELHYKNKPFLLPPIPVFYFLLIFPFKLLLAFIFNLNRISSALNVLNFKDKL